MVINSIMLYGCYVGIFINVLHSTIVVVFIFCVLNLRCLLCMNKAIVVIYQLNQSSASMILILNALAVERTLSSMENGCVSTCCGTVKRFMSRRKNTTNNNGMAELSKNEDSCALRPNGLKRAAKCTKTWIHRLFTFSRYMLRASRDQGKSIVSSIQTHRDW